MSNNRFFVGHNYVALGKAIHYLATNNIGKDALTAVTRYY